MNLAELAVHTLIIAPNSDAFDLHNCYLVAPNNHRRRVSIQPVRVGGRWLIAMRFTGANIKGEPAAGRGESCV